MKLLSRVCAEFTDEKGQVIYRIGPADRLVYKDDAPEAIRGCLLFRMLVADGSLEVIETVEQRKKLESDPKAGTDASGRKKAEAEPEAKAEAGVKGKTAEPGAAGGERKK